MNERPMRPTFAFLAFLLAVSFAATGQDWPRWSSPEEAGFSSQAVAAAERAWQALPDAPVASFFLVYKGRVLASFGSETYPYWCHSMRKSFLSALYGIHVDKGNLDLHATLTDLGIDDLVPLTATEKQARVVDLLRARSGIYIEAACEAQSMKDARPARGSHLPGTFWYYNNWDFNALGTIFREQTGRDIFEEFNSRIARKIGMQDFVPSSCEYFYEVVLSEHPCYTFRMSPRDRARLGQLLLQNGRWGDRQILPPDWIEESVQTHSTTGIPGRGYGYMWWTYGPAFFELTFADPRLHHLRGYSASGYGGQAIMVLPGQELVVVFSADVPAGGDIDIEETAPILETILTSPKIVDLEAVRVKAKSPTTLAADRLRSVIKIRNRSSERSRTTQLSVYLTQVRGLTREAIWIGEATLPALGSGERKTLRLKTRLPANLEPGRYYLAAVVDDAKANYDLRRDNNVAVGKKAIRIPG